MMNTFFQGFEKQAGITDFFRKMLGRSTQAAPKSKPTIQATFKGREAHPRGSVVDVRRPAAVRSKAKPGPTLDYSKMHAPGEKLPTWRRKFEESRRQTAARSKGVEYELPRGVSLKPT